MRIRAVLNREGGTLKTMDLEMFSDHLREVFGREGHDFDVCLVNGKEMEDALEQETSAGDLDAIIAGGGDGTVSCAAAHAWKNGMPLGVLPAGTMNLFARSIGVPLDIMVAASALARAPVRQCDIGTANGRPFVHQISVGMQSRMIDERKRSSHKSRFGKILASVSATFSMLSRPPRFPAVVTVDGERVADGRFSVVSISNNPFGEGHLPYADRLDQGVLGVYHAAALDRGASARLTTDLIMGSWAGNSDFKTGSGRKVELEFPRPKRSARVVVDGELIRLAPKVSVEIHPGELKLLVPTAD
ncbi:diacylglycerol kinase family lipid kinase [Hwanghaeella grinnelliae]|uniref:Diacylglycerol kinase family lipid kinase n=1 Tax=Hwanghaeella grinnelliae TaxID=2500179 RepID=A0A3S2VPN9_9PROT|nr:diacylglycerol kinase family protein [Hwanghaeella grinnelliae]RVU38713.1 diacylglycerol kinase family lipid kinase [Hwanghaeella grinnelliae]